MNRIETAPIGAVVLLKKRNGGWIQAICEHGTWDASDWGVYVNDHEIEGWLPLPEIKEKHPLDDVKFSDATPEQFKEFWEAKGLTCWDGNIGGQLEFARCQIEVTINDGYIYIQDERNYVLVGEATTFGEAAEAIAALENALGRFGE